MLYHAATLVMGLDACGEDSTLGSADMQHSAAALAMGMDPCDETLSATRTAVHVPQQQAAASCAAWLTVSRHMHPAIQLMTTYQQPPPTHAG